MNLHPDRPERSELPKSEASLRDALRQLEIATSSAAQLSIVAESGVPATSAETAALGESWLALSQLLDSNTPPVDEAKLLAQVRHRVGRQATRRRWQGAGLALAASLMLAATMVWLATRSSNGPLHGNSTRPIADDPRIETPIEPPQYVAVEPVSEESSAVNFDDAYWQDDLADDLAQTQQEFANIRTNWAQRPDPMAWMQFQMNEFEHELGDSSL